MRRLFFSPAIMVALLAVITSGGCHSPDEPPADPQQRFSEAITLLRNGAEFETVRQTAEDLQKTDGFEQHGQLLEAGLRLRRGDHVRALREFQSLQPRGELVAPARLWTAESLYRTGLLADARECIAPLVDEPDYAADAHRWLAAIEYDLGANEAALAHLQELIRLSPDDYRPRALAARMYQDFGQHEAASRHYEAALKLAPPPAEHQEFSIGLARALIAQRDYSHALEVLLEASADATVLALRSECHRQLAEPEKAAVALESALKLDATNVDVLSRHADALLSDNQPEEAIRVLKKLVDLKPFDHEARYRLSLAYRQAGQTDQAEQEMARVTKLREQYDRLSELNNRAIQSPNDAAVRRELAELCDHLGRPQLAAVWRRAAAVIEHSNQQNNEPRKAGE